LKKKEFYGHGLPEVGVKYNTSIPSVCLFTLFSNRMMVSLRQGFLLGGPEIAVGSTSAILLFIHHKVRVVKTSCLRLPQAVRYSASFILPWWARSAVPQQGKICSYIAISQFSIS
jgi:hypothetical protein